MSPRTRVVVVGDLEATRLVCTLLTGDGFDIVHLLAPDEAALRAAFVEPSTTWRSWCAGTSPPFASCCSPSTSSRTFRWS